MLGKIFYMSAFRSQFFHGGPSHNFRRMGALGRGVWYTAKPTITGKMCLLDPKLYLSLFASQSPYTFCMGKFSPNCGRRGGVGRPDVVPSESLPL